MPERIDDEDEDVPRKRRRIDDDHDVSAPRKKKKKKKRSSSTAIIIVSVGLVVLLAVGIGGWLLWQSRGHAPQAASGGEKAKDNTGLPTWTPDAAMIDTLADEFPIDAYMIRPPKGYRHKNVPSPAPGIKYFQWDGDLRAEGLAPMFLITITTLPTNEKPPSLAEFYSVAMSVGQEASDNWKTQPNDKGTVNGLTFLRGQWSGVSKKHGLKIHGVDFLAIDGNILIRIQIQDIEPPVSLKLGEAAAATFRKK
jgi:hypothetical protein